MLLVFGFIAKSQVLLQSDFQKPSKQYQPRVWWRWIGGNVSKEGITKDLEEISAKGINGITFFNLGAFYPKGEITFGTPEWDSLFLFTVSECNRLGLDFSFQLCDGWGASGGPWVLPENAMKFLSSSKINIAGGKKIVASLPQPHTKLNFYKDIKVYAFPQIDNSLHLFNKANIKVTFGGWNVNPQHLIDGDRYSETMFGYKTDDTKRLINFEFKKTTPISQINIYHTSKESPVGIQECELQFSNDSINYTTIGRFKLNDIMGSFSFRPIEAKYYRIKINKFTPASGNGSWAFISEIEMLSPTNVSDLPKINDFEVKAAVWHRRRGCMESLDVPVKNCIPREKILDITQYMDKNGLLQWNAPAGNWTIVRMGYTLTGRENGPATKEGTGLECDKLSSEAIELFFNGYAGKWIDTIKNTGDTALTRLFHDSFEALSQNWTESLPSEFQKRRGYNMMDWFVVLSGEVVDNIDVSERFLFDLRLTLSEMLADNYYKKLNTLCNEHGIKFVAQVGGEQQMQTNPMLYGQQVDVPAMEIWVDRDDKRNFSFKGFSSLYDVISVSRQNNHPVIPTEAFTALFNDFSVTPAILKPIADKAFTIGINQLELHKYIHQPDESYPGLQHLFGIFYGRKLTWWKYAGELNNYFTKIQSVMQKGQTIADVLFYTGENIPTDFEFAYHATSPYHIMPHGYTCDMLDKNTMLNAITCKDGIFNLPNGIKYKVLVLPKANKMSLNVLLKIEEFLLNGGIIIGQKPESCYSLTDLGENEKQLQVIADRIWENHNKNFPALNTYGKGRVYSGMEIGEVLSKEKILPDFTYTTSVQNPELLYIHKEIEGSHVYFVSNQKNEGLQAELIFRMQGLQPEMWNTETGEISILPVFSFQDKQTRIPVNLKPYQSVMFVFRSAPKQTYCTRILENNKVLFPFAQTQTEYPEIVYNSKQSISISTNRNSDYVITDSRGDVTRFKAKGSKPDILLKDRWNVTFSDSMGVVPSTVIFDTLYSWTKSKIDNIRFYSGTASYSKVIELPSKYIENNMKYILDLGKVKDIAEIHVNGKLIATRIFPPYSCDISGALKTGKNTIEIKVTNTWDNRIIGDDLHPDKPRYTIYPVKGYQADSEREKYSSEDQLWEAGLIGPVKISTYWVK